MKQFYLGLAVALTIYVPSQSFAQQPFTNIQQAPTVSPYLNLSNGSNRGSTNYQSLVRPLLEQQQTNQQQQRQIQHLAQSQKDLTTGGLTQPARGVATSIRGTGHVAGFMVHGNYYPQPQISTNDPITRRLVTLNYNQ
jgi:hypothetical protein